MFQFIPSSILEFFANHAPVQKLEHARHTARVATDVARELVSSKSEALLQGEGNRDIMSLLGSFTGVCSLTRRH